MSKAYFNCHTDITIPYSELGSIIAYDKANKSNADARKQRRKVFGKSDGEYVRFEEISIADNEPTVPETSFDKNKVEPRISDAEFEEILYNKRHTDE